MSGFTLKQLEYFVACVQTGSLSAAARACHVSHAGISNGLNELERAIGTQVLVRRKAKGVFPTAAGRALLPLARNMLRDAAGIDLLGRGAPEALSGELGVGCTLALSPALLPYLASAFADHHPGVDLRFLEGSGGDVLAALRDGQIDVGLLLERQVTGDVETLHVCRVRVQAALPSSHPLAQRPSLTLAELAGEPAIAPSGSALESMLAVMHEAGVEPTVRWTLTSPEPIRSMVARGFGYSGLNTFPHDPVDSRVVAVPLTDASADNALVIALPPGRRRAAVIDALAEHLRANAAHLLVD